MICAFLRVVQHVEKLPASWGRQLLPHSMLTKASLKTQPLRWGLLEQKKTVRPRTVWGFTQKTFWTQGPDPQKAKEDSSKQVSVSRNQRGETSVSTSQKVKEAGRDFTYLVVVLFGVSITGGLFYTIFKELFSSSSPNIIYGKALEKCRTHPEVISVFGEPVKGYGEMSRRGRRQHVSFIEYAKNGLKRIRVKFYIEGSEPGKHGTVHAEVEEGGKWWHMRTLQAENNRLPRPVTPRTCLVGSSTVNHLNPQSGRFEFRYVFVEVAPTRSIVVEDNRSQES